MTYVDAQTIASELVSRLGPHCEQLVIAGSLRRKRPGVNDIDLVLIPKKLPDFVSAVMDLYGRRPEKCGEKIIMLEHYESQWHPALKPIQVDLYLATPKTWATLLLIRTGSKDHNIKLARRAKECGFQLKANGDGLINNSGTPDVRLRCDSEAEIFACLGLPYREPWEREV